MHVPDKFQKFTYVNTSYKSMSSTPKPFVKWAGGKRQILNRLMDMLPNNYGTYYEPFLGGGALFFYILRHKPSHRYCVSDLNQELIFTYEVIRDHVDELIELLNGHADTFRNSKEYYYRVRSQSPDTPVEKAARMIFLNKTCYNGLYRVNSKNEFNVPIGSYVNPRIVHEDNLRSISKILNSNNITIQCNDFEETVQHAERGDMIYFDPPYQPINSTSSFTQYTRYGFSYEELKRLSGVCESLHNAGCSVMISNSDMDVVEQLFSNDIWHVKRVGTARAINSVGTKRVGHQELLITNYAGPQTYL